MRTPFGISPSILFTRRKSGALFSFPSHVSGLCLGFVLLAFVAKMVKASLLMYFVVEAEVEEDAKNDARDFSHNRLINKQQTVSVTPSCLLANSYSASPLLEVGQECNLSFFTDQAPLRDAVSSLTHSTFGIQGDVP